MINLADLAPICIAITDLYDPHPAAVSPEELPAQYAMDADRKAAARSLIRRMLEARLVSRRHSRALAAVIRTWEGQPAVVRSMTFGALDLFRMIECNPASGDAPRPQ